MKNIIKYASLSLIAAALAITPALTRAQDASTNAPAMAPADGSTTNTPPPMHKKKKGAGLPFHGKIATIDASAGTFTVGELSLTVTSPRSPRMAFRPRWTISKWMTVWRVTTRKRRTAR